MFVRQRLSKTVPHLAIWVFTCVALLSSATASDSLIFNYSAGITSAGGYVAKVTLQHDTLIAANGKISVKTTFVSIQPDQGWTYKIVKSGGINSPVQIDLQKGTYIAKFKVDYKPGSTVIDAGVIRCK